MHLNHHIHQELRSPGNLHTLHRDGAVAIFCNGLAQAQGHRIGYLRKSSKTAFDLIDIQLFTVQNTELISPFDTSFC